MRVVSLHTYPVKGCHRVDAEAADVEPWGLAGDRRWLIVDADTGRAVTQREVSVLATIRPVLTDLRQGEPAPGGAVRGGEPALVLRAPGQPDLVVPAPVGGPRVTVGVWRDEIPAAHAGAAADAWLTAVIGREVRLTFLDDPTQRQVNPQYGAPEDRVGFADGYPVLLANTASLDALNAALAEPVPMTRFRPNVVVEGAAPWAEDTWIGRRLWIGQVAFRVPKPCDRCVVTTIDQETGERGREPLRTLGRLRRFPLGLLFAVNLIPDGVGRIAVGDEVKLITG
jgi:uncharacterized protein YcbX